LEIIYNNLKVSLPDAIIVGAAKAGTTSLFNYLSDHPQIFKPRIKEPWFFSYKDNIPNFIIPTNGKPNTKEIITDEVDYFNLFKNENKYLIEGSTSYLYTAKDTIENIKEIYGDSYSDLKIVIVLRNPVQRAWSHYIMHVRDGKTNLSFFDSIKESIIKERLKRGCIIGYDYIGFGLYYSQVKLFMKTFSNVKIIIYDEYKKNSRETLDDLTNFFDLDGFNYCTDKKYNVSGVPKNRIYKIISNLLTRESFFKSYLGPIFLNKFLYNQILKLKSKMYKKKLLNESDKKVLIEIYREDVKLLENLIKVDLCHWLK